VLLLSYESKEAHEMKAHLLTSGAKFLGSHTVEAIIAATVTIAGTAIYAGLTDGASAKPPAAPSPLSVPLGQAVRGKALLISALSGECGFTALRARPQTRHAQGQFCVLNIQITNISHEPVTDGLLSATVDFGLDRLPADRELSNFYRFSLIPRATVSATVTVDAPAGERPTQAQFVERGSPAIIVLPLAGPPQPRKAPKADASARPSVSAPRNPSVYGQEETAARRSLTSAGWRVNTEHQCSFSVGKGRVRQVFARTSTGLEVLVEDGPGVPVADVRKLSTHTLVLHVSTGFCR
jgi:hypothetical protein